ncbi:carboxypeptidase regulatory-like domain-containing protein [Reichenbachiella agarivorans]|uniref:Carboxypeptidase regulatory-like domain-containing protein n=1 Tax=Reichenbachiella agarivorans TaxID=2979464 RepID=A0ABY6CPK9_9BACT|nr:carboxypeptidase regulatory-like domain-containing protein [Reichenbachiella agarivorans]UXP32450.1 carboxypeptidase regulatory-like domain-containing protein [Reichenbachiella agarivorans]
MKKILLGLIAVLAINFISSTTMAQVTNSNMEGLVRDNQGEPLIGATVKAVHEPTGTQYGTVTNVEGNFSLPNLKTGGPYSVTINYVGYQPVKYEGINLKLGNPYSLTATMNESDVLEEVVIESSKSEGDFNSTRTGAATNLSNEQINTLPTIQRSISDFTRLTPQANGNSFAGRDGRYNNVQIDGANFNNGFGLSSDPLPGGNAQPISLDAIQEVTVSIAPYDVRQSGFTGAGINAVTRSGTNQFEGSAYYFFRNQNMTGDQVGDLDIGPLDDVSSKTTGFRLGGPIIKNKLFFFANAEFVKNEGTNPFAVNQWEASQDGVGNPDQNIARTTEADLIAVRNHLINTFGYDPGEYQGYAKDAGDESRSFFARLDWNISEKHKLALRYSNVFGTQNNLVNGSSGPRPRSSVNRVSDQSMAFESTQYSTDNIVNSFAVELSSYFNQSLSNQFIATYSKIQAKRTSASDGVFPTIDIWEDGTNYITAGYDPFTYGNDVLNDNISVINNLTYLKGNHEVTAGLAFETQTFGNQFLRLGASYYRYNSVDDFLTTGTAGEVAPIMFGVTYPYEGADTYAPITLGTAGVYVQDKFRVSDDLVVTAGVRIEAPIFLNDLTANPSIDALTFHSPDGGDKNYESGEWPTTKLNVSPRVGFNYDVLGDGSLKLRGGTGIFYGRLPFVWLTNMPTGSGVISNNVEPSSYDQVAGWIGNVTFNPDKYHWVDNPPAGAEDVFISNPNAGAPSSLALVDSDLKMPSVWRTSLGGDYSLSNLPITLSADLMYTRDVNAVYQFNANRGDAPTTLNYGNDNRDFYPTGPVSYNPAMGANNAVVLTNTDTKGNVFNATVGGNLNTRNGFYGSLFYTYTYSDEISSNAGSSASSAIAGPNVSSPNEQVLYNSQYAVPHRVVGSISYKINYLQHAATTISLYYSGSHQGRYSYTYSSDFNNDGINSDLLYVPADNSEINFVDIVDEGVVVFTAAEQLAAFNEYINDDPYLSERRGKYAERNSNLMPWLNRFDFRLLQDLYTNIGKSKNTLQLSLDIFNVANLLNSDWGVSQTMNNAQNLLKPVTVTENGVPTFQMNTVSVDGQTVLPTKATRDITTTASTYYMQIGVRYIFGN